jgi:hypothetical protein
MTIWNYKLFASLKNQKFHFTVGQRNSSQKQYRWKWKSFCNRRQKSKVEKFKLADCVPNRTISIDARMVEVYSPKGLSDLDNGGWVGVRGGGRRHSCHLPAVCKIYFIMLHIYEVIRYQCTVQRPNSWTQLGRKSSEFSSLLFTVTSTVLTDFTPPLLPKQKWFKTGW